MERPSVHLNCATSRDGRLAAANGSPVRFSDDEDLRRVHGLRAGCDAILVGIGTVLADDPHLTVKAEHLGRDDVEHPLRVVLDSHGRTAHGARVLDDVAPTLVVTGADAPPVPGAQQLRVASKGGRLDLHAVLEHLHMLGIRSVLVEGGEAVLRSFLTTGLWDQFTLYQSPEVLGGDGPRLWDNGGPDALGLNVESKQDQGAGTLWSFSQ